MGENNWMASEGLDFDMSVLGIKNEHKMKVVWGDFTGNFVSFSSKEKTLMFILDDPVVVFSKLSNAPNVAQVFSGEEVYTIEWASYNYVVTNTVGNVILTVEEKQG